MNGEPLPLIARAGRFGPRTALLADDGQRWTYDRLLDVSARLAGALLGEEDDLHQRRIAFLVGNGPWYAAAQWAIWRAGGIAVPLAVMHPRREWEYVLDDAQVSALVVDRAHGEVAQPLAGGRNLPLLVAEESSSPAPRGLPQVAASRRAMILYTSGTTSRPKGVVTTHANIAAQIESLVAAWQWTSEDRILHTLPLHHIHGIINLLGCALWSGAACEMLPKFDAEVVLRRIAESRELTLYMAVPTIYARLAAAWERAEPDLQRAFSEGCRRLRLMVSGSAALPVRLLETWQRISGHTLLERYGMTEIGMALSNPLHGPRVAGHVGTPLPGIEVRLVDEQGQPVADGQPGEIQVRGPGVFGEYWNRPQETAAAFTAGGWFKTGDVAVCRDGVYRILGRSSTDIIKTGGYKVSALEIEEVLREHPAVVQCAVVGVPDDQWGEAVGVALVLRDGDRLDLASLREWAKGFLAPYKVPTRVVCLDELPRNAMGKVVKPALVAQFGRD